MRSRWKEIVTLVAVALVAFCIGTGVQQYLQFSSPEEFRFTQEPSVAEVSPPETIVVQSTYKADGFQTVTVADSAVTHFDSTVTVPAGSEFVWIQAYDGNIRLRDDGTDPTTAIGFCIFSGGDHFYDGDDLTAIDLVSESGNVEVNLLFRER